MNEPNPKEVHLRVIEDCRSEFGFDPTPYDDDKIELFIKLLMTYRWNTKRINEGFRGPNK